MPDQLHHSTVVALACDGLCTFEFGRTYEIFGLSRPELNRPWYRFEVCAAEPGLLRAAGGLAVQTPHDRAVETLRHHFRRLVGTTPTAYRQAFGRLDVSPPNEPAARQERSASLSS